MADLSPTVADYSLESILRLLPVYVAVGDTLTVGSGATLEIVDGFATGRFTSTTTNFTYSFFDASESTTTNGSINIQVGDMPYWGHKVESGFDDEESIGSPSKHRSLPRQSTFEETVLSLPTGNEVVGKAFIPLRTTTAATQDMVAELYTMDPDGGGAGIPDVLDLIAVSEITTIPGGGVDEDDLVVQEFTFSPGLKLAAGIDVILCAGSAATADQATRIGGVLPEITGDVRGKLGSLQGEDPFLATSNYNVNTVGWVEYTLSTTATVTPPYSIEISEDQTKTEATAGTIPDTVAGKFKIYLGASVNMKDRGSIDGSLLACFNHLMFIAGKGADTSTDTKVVRGDQYTAGGAVIFENVTTNILATDVAIVVDGDFGSARNQTLMYREAYRKALQILLESSTGN